MDVSHPIRSVLRTLDGPVLEVLAGTNAPLSLTRLASLAGAGSLSGVRLSVLRLVDHGIVEALPGGYRLNREHLATPAIVALARMRAELLNRIGEVADGWGEAPALLGVFGSFARRDGDAHSDIDLLLVSEAQQAPEQAGMLSEQVRVWTGNPCHIIVLKSSDLVRMRRHREGILDQWHRDIEEIRGDVTVLAGPVE